MISDFDVSDAYQDLLEDYTRTRFTISNTYQGEVRTPTTDTISLYVHPDDYEKNMYDAQGQRIEFRIKIFCDLTTDIIVNDEVTYNGNQYKVIGDNYKKVGNYKKLIAELVKQ